MSAGTPLPGTPTPMHYWPGAAGVRIAGDAWGPIDGPLVLLQHGGGQTRHAWKGTGETLGAAGYRAVAFDARGHGDSDWAPDGRYGQDLMVEDLKCVVAALGARRPVLVGASMGGGTSLTAIGEDHVDATALVLVLTIRPAPTSARRAWSAQKPASCKACSSGWISRTDTTVATPPHAPKDAHKLASAHRADTLWHAVVAALG